MFAMWCGLFVLRSGCMLWLVVASSLSFVVCCVFGCVLFDVWWFLVVRCVVGCYLWICYVVRCLFVDDCVCLLWF